jgi:hypothetical protein
VAVAVIESAGVRRLTGDHRLHDRIRDCASRTEAGARVTLLAGPTSLETTAIVSRIDVRSTAQILEAVSECVIFVAVAGRGRLHAGRISLGEDKEVCPTR